MPLLPLRFSSQNHQTQVATQITHQGGNPIVPPTSTSRLAKIRSWKLRIRRPQVFNNHQTVRAAPNGNTQTSRITQVFGCLRILFPHKRRNSETNRNQPNNRHAQRNPTDGNPQTIADATVININDLGYLYDNANSLIENQKGKIERFYAGQGNAAEVSNLVPFLTDARKQLESADGSPDKIEEIKTLLDFSSQLLEAVKAQEISLNDSTSSKSILENHTDSLLSAMASYTSGKKDAPVQKCYEKLSEARQKFIDTGGNKEDLALTDDILKAASQLIDANTTVNPQRITKLNHSDIILKPTDPQLNQSREQLRNTLSQLDTLLRATPNNLHDTSNDFLNSVNLSVREVISSLNDFSEVIKEGNHFSKALDKMDRLNSWRHQAGLTTPLTIANSFLETPANDFLLIMKAHQSIQQFKKIQPQIDNFIKSRAH